MILFTILSIIMPSRNLSDAESVLTQAAKACHSLKSVKYSIEGTLFGQEFQATIWQKDAGVPDSGFAKGKYMVRGDSTGAKKRERFEFAYDGASLRVKDMEDNTTKVLSNPQPQEVAQQLPQVAGLLPMPIMGDYFLARSKKNAGLKLLADKKFGSFSCDVIELKQEINNPAIGSTVSTATWAFDKTTHLPIYCKTVVGEKTITAISVNPDLADSMFTLSGKQLAANPLGVQTDSLLKIGTKPPSFTAKDGTGKSRSLADYKGKVVVIDFWGTWCVPCRKTMPILEKLHRTYGQKGLVVLGVAVADKEASPIAFMKRMGYTYPIIVSGDKVASAYKAKLLPTLYMIDRSGKIAYRQAGLQHDDEKYLPKIVASLIAKK